MFRLAAALCVLFASVLIAGCAAPKRAIATFDAQTSFWQGRLAVNVHSKPPQAFSADFELEGAPAAGTLRLSTAIGTTIAKLEWSGSEAFLHANAGVQRFSSLEALTLNTIGTELPVASLFSWLKGISQETPGWEADLSLISEGRITAKHLDEAAPANLKIILER
jgi:outer membrane lipoprotein LolB